MAESASDIASPIQLALPPRFIVASVTAIVAITLWSAIVFVAEALAGGKLLAESCDLHPIHNPANDTNQSEDASDKRNST